MIASNAYSIASFVPPLLGIPEFRIPVHIAGALGVVDIMTGLNLIGPAVLKILTRLSLAAEVIGSVVLTTVLLIRHREQPLSILFTSGGAADRDYLWGGFILAVGLSASESPALKPAAAWPKKSTDPRRTYQRP